MAAIKPSIAGRTIPASACSRRRDLIELAVAYGLILLVIWTPRPWQRILWWVAAAAVVAIASASFEGLQAMGLRRENFLRSLWIVGAALLVSAVAVVLAIWLRTLHVPSTPLLFIETYVGYVIWTFAQQLLMQCFFLSRFLRLLPSAKLAALVTAIIFAAAHLPSPILVPVTLLWGLASCLLFLRYGNLYTLAIAHAILGVTLAIAVPAAVHHNMRVGLGYLTYGRTHAATPSAQP
ncbi:MAG TPA: CPBP family intramembrane glutamic endopeptidase [Terracidiphilus sp.]|nr:CPBP family intramembrane glutamic endopeptidase [Terracidiphilus sp.]